jgi:hypothetical protein
MGSRKLMSGGIKHKQPRHLPGLFVFLKIMSLRAKRGNRLLYREAKLPCDCFVVPPRKDIQG